MMRRKKRGNKGGAKLSTCYLIEAAIRALKKTTNKSVSTRFKLDILREVFIKNNHKINKIHVKFDL